MEDTQTQTPSAAESTPEPAAAPPASAPDSRAYGPSSWEAAFAPDDGASNRGTDGQDQADDSAPTGASAAEDASAASKPEGAPAGGDTSAQREPQPGSRRSTAAEVDSLRDQVKTVLAELETERQKASELQAQQTAATEQAEAWLGKPGELAQLLSKEARQGWLDHEEQERKLRLIQGAELYAPLLAKARDEARVAVAHELEQANGGVQTLLANLSKELQTATALTGVDAAFIEKPDTTLRAILAHVHKAGAASRDGEIAELKGQLDDARARAFTSQPQLATGGVSSGSASRSGYDPNKTPVANLEETFARAASSPNGRR